MSSVRLDGRRVGDAVRFLNLPDLTAWIASVPDGARIRATFEELDTDYRDRLEQLYWKTLREAGEYFGYDRSEQHQVFWSGLVGVPTSGGILADLTTLRDDDLSRYVQDALRLSAEAGCVIATT